MARIQFVLLVALLALGAGAYTLARTVEDPWIGVGVVGAAVLVLGRLLTRWAQRPLEELHEVTDAVLRGDTGRRIMTPGRPTQSLANAIQRMGEELRRQFAEVTGEKERLQAVLQGMAEGVLVLDRAGHVVLANPRLQELFSAWGPVEGRTPLEVIRRADVQEALDAAAESAEAVTTEIPLGNERHVQVHAARFPRTGERVGTVAVFHDLTEIRRLEGIRQEFVANVSHELKTPLTAIRGFAEVLGTQEVSAEQRGQYLDVIQRHADRLSALIEDLLELSRIEGGKLPLDPVTVPMPDVARSILQDMKPRFDSRRIDFHLESSGTGLALADRRAVEQVLVNLLDNAAKYTDEGGRIDVRIRAQGDFIRTDVCDDGMGIPEVDQSRIFERFYRVDKARSRDLGGTGLGLAIVKHLVQGMGGQVQVQSEEGEGTTFSFLLPADGVPPQQLTLPEGGAAR